MTLDEGHVYCVAAVVTDRYGRSWVAWSGETVTYDAVNQFAQYVNTDYTSDTADWDY